MSAYQGISRLSGTLLGLGGVERTARISFILARRTRHVARTGLAGAAIVGSVIYPPLMGVLSARIGLSRALIGGAILGIPAALGQVGASWLARRRDAGVSVVRDKAA